MTIPGPAGRQLLVYAAYAWLPGRGRRWWPATWCGLLVITWLGLVLTAPSFAWCAVPLAFVALRVLPFPVACGVLGVMVVTVAVAWGRMQTSFDPTVLVGPACVAVLVVLAYRALEREAAHRQRLLDDLREAQGELAETQHRAGVLAERTRLSRELHDSVAQELSSINLLLQAAELDWEDRPTAARGSLGQAARTARDGLDEVRRVVRDLAPSELAADASGEALPAALRELGRQTVLTGGVPVTVAVHGRPVPLPDEVATALLRAARGALANVVEHSGAGQAAVTLTYQDDSVSLDVRDDGRGFDPVGSAANGDRGRGLAGIRSRVDTLGGQLVVESAAGEGTALAVSLPVGPTP